MNQTKKEITQNPGRDDVHEQREPAQPREGVVEAPPDAPTSSPKPVKRGDAKGSGSTHA